jgi:hypothetical protein
MPHRRVARRFSLHPNRSSHGADSRAETEPKAFKDTNVKTRQQRARRVTPMSDGIDLPTHVILTRFQGRASSNDIKGWVCNFTRNVQQSRQAASIVSARLHAQPLGATACYVVMYAIRVPWSNSTLRTSWPRLGTSGGSMTRKSDVLPDRCRSGSGRVGKVFVEIARARKRNKDRTPERMQRKFRAFFRKGGGSFPGKARRGCHPSPAGPLDWYLVEARAPLGHRRAPAPQTPAGMANPQAEPRCVRAVRPWD